MKRVLGVRFLLLLFAVGMLFLWPQSVRADAIYNITTNNVGASGSLGTVDLHLNGNGTVTITVSANPGVHLLWFGMTPQIPLTVQSISASPSLTMNLINCSGKGQPCKFDGYGSFVDVWKLPSGASTGGVQQLVLTAQVNGSFTSLSQLFASGGFAIHFLLSNGLTGDGIVGPPSITPEPSSLLLFGTGIVGLGTILRRKSRH